MCQGTCLIDSGCECLHNRRDDHTQKRKSEIRSGHGQIRKLVKNDMLEDLINMLSREESGMVYVVPTEEINHPESKTELTMAHQHKLNKSDNTESPTQYDNTVLLKPSAGTLVMTDSVTTDCSEEELLHCTDVDDTKEATVCCHTNCTASYVYPEEESGLNPNDTFTVSERATQQNIDFALTKELSRDVKAFLSDDDGTSHNEATFGILSSDRRNFNYSDYSLKAKIVGNSQLIDAYCESDRPHKPQDDHLKLPYPTNSNGPIKEPVAG